jgi:hypothetical protein
MGTRRFWQPAELELIRQLYADTPTREIAQQLGRPIAGVWRIANNLGLRKSLKCIADQSRARTADPNHGSRRTYFVKGHLTYNKGKKMPGWAPGRMAETQFKKGGRNANWMPIGATRKIDDYLYVKVSDVPYVPYTVNWKPVHIQRWEEANGKMPARHVLIFKDGNRDNFDLANLELLTRAELMRRNTIHKLPEDLKDVIRLNQNIKRRIRKQRSSNGE